MLWIDAHRRKSGEHAATRPADGRSEYPRIQICILVIEVIDRVP